MKLENQVCTLQQAEKLKKLGVKQNSLFVYYRGLSIEMHGIHLRSFFDGKNVENAIYGMWTIAELGVMFGIGTRATDWLVNVKIDTSTKTLMWRPEFLADCLIEALENNLTTAAEVNERLKQN